jgi:hypothetical protein
MMKKLVAALVLVGTLGMASGAMAHENRHTQPRDGKKYVEPRGESHEFGMWIKLPLSNSKPDNQHRERDERKRDEYRHDRGGHQRPRYRS